MKWVMNRSLPYTHEFELETDRRVEIKLSCHEKEIMPLMRSIFGKNVEVELFNDEE